MDTSKVTEVSVNRLCTLSAESFVDAYREMENFSTYLESRVAAVFSHIEFNKIDTLKDQWEKEDLSFYSESLFVSFYSWFTDYQGTERREKISTPAYIEMEKVSKEQDKPTVIRSWQEKQRGMIIYFFIEMEFFFFLELEEFFNITPDRSAELVLSQSRTKESFRDALYQVMSGSLSKELRIKLGFSDEQSNSNFSFSTCETIYDESDLSPNSSHDIFGMLEIGMKSTEGQEPFLTFSLKNKEWITLEGEISVGAFLEIIYDAAANRSFRPSKTVKRNI